MDDLRSLLSKKVLIPMQKTASGNHYFKARRHQYDLESRQFDEPGKILARKNAVFTELMKHCCENVPYYRRIMGEAGLGPKDFSSIDDLKKLPVLEKATVKNRLHELTAINFRPNEMKYMISGGTTGNPTRFALDLRNNYKMLGKDWWLWSLAGYELGMRTAIFWGNPQELEKKNRIHARAKRFCEHTALLNTWQFTAKNLVDYSGFLNRYRPQVIRGFSSAIYNYVKTCNENGIRRTFDVKCVIATSDKLYGREKAQIADYFDAPVFEEYGCREFSLIAHECEKHQGLHCADEMFVIEVMNKKGEIAREGTGELLVTYLNNWAVPLLRYRLGDVITIASARCTCGRNSTTLSSIEGRVGEYALTKSGARIHSDFFNYLFYVCKGIEKYRIYQYAKGEIEIHAVRNENYDAAEIALLMNNLKLMQNGDLTATVKYVDDIPLLQSGKRLLLVSKLGDTN